MTKVVIFDFDDTLVKSERLKQKSFWEIFDLLGQPVLTLAREHVLEHLGQPREEMIRGLVAYLQATDLLGDVDYRKWLDLYSRTVETRIIIAPEVPGALRAILDLHLDHKLYVNSATPQETLERILAGRGWENHFHRVFGSPPGTKEEHVSEIRCLAETNPGEVVIVGDGLSDLRCAQLIGAHFIGVRGEFSKFPADDKFPIIDDLTTLPELVRSI